MGIRDPMNAVNRHPGRDWRGQIAWVRLGKVLKAHGYGPCTLDTGNPCRYDGSFGLCRFG